MSSGPVIGGKGVVLSYSTTSGGSYTPVGKIVAYKPPKTKIGKSETTTFDDNGIEQFIAAFQNCGECGFNTLYLQPGTTTATLIALLGTMLFWKFTFPDGSVMPWEAFLDEFTPNVPLKEKITAEWSMTITGGTEGTTFAAGS